MVAYSEPIPHGVGPVSGPCAGRDARSHKEAPERVLKSAADPSPAPAPVPVSLAASATIPASPMPMRLALALALALAHAHQIRAPQGSNPPPFLAQKCQKMPKTAYHSSIHDLWTPAGKPVVLTTRSRRRLTRRGVRHTWARSLNTGPALGRGHLGAIWGAPGATWGGIWGALTIAHPPQ